MGRIVSQFFMSLDGVVGRPDRFHLPYFDEDMGTIINETLSRSRGVLLGRRLHDEWAAYWPDKAAADDEFAGFINPIPKYVLSTTLRESPWEGATVISEDAAARLRALKEETDGDLTMSGSATTVRWLIAEGLLDVLELLVDPVLVGSGQRLFEGQEVNRLRLEHSRALATGVLHLRYVPVTD